MTSRNHTLLFFLSIVLAPSVLLADDNPSYIGVIISFYENGLEFVSEDKKSSIVLNSKGLFVDNTYLCGSYREGWWSEGLGSDKDYSKPDTCPVDSPIRSGSYYNMGGLEPAGLFYTGIRILSIKDGLVRISYKNKIYSGSVGGRLFPGKGSQIEKQFEAEVSKIKSKELKKLQTIGLLSTLNALKRCLVPKLKTQACFANLLPSGDQKFVVDLANGEEKYSIAEIYKKLSAEIADTPTSDDSFFAHFLHCTNSHGDAAINDAKGEVTFGPADNNEFGWGMRCIFKLNDGKWIFSGLSWHGC